MKPNKEDKLKSHPLEVQLIAWKLIKWNAEKEIKVVQAKMDKKIKQLKEDNGGTS